MRTSGVKQIEKVSGGRRGQNDTVEVFKIYLRRIHFKIKEEK